MVLIFDATFDGLLSAAAYCFRQKLTPDGLISETDEQPLIDCLHIPREANIRGLFQRHLRKICGRDAGEIILDTAFRAFLSEQDGIAGQIWLFLARALELRRDPSPRLFEADIAAVVHAARRVGAQAHKYLGLLRFKEVCPLFLVADFAPDYHVLPIILPHFADRMSGQCFAIRDLKRHIAAYHPPGGPVSILVLEDDRIPEPGALSGLLERSAGSPALLGPPDTRLAACEDRQIPEKAKPGMSPADETDFEKMWRSYLKRLSIPERRNPALQRANMPKKYWKYLVEDDHAL